MKALKDLTKNELLSFISNYDGTINIYDNMAECAVCGEKSNVPYNYCCDKCHNNM